MPSEVEILVERMPASYLLLPKSKQPGDGRRELVESLVIAEPMAAVIHLQCNLRDGFVNQADHLRIAAKLGARRKARGHRGLCVRVVESGKSVQGLFRARREEPQHVVGDLCVSTARLRRHRARGLQRSPTTC